MSVASSERRSSSLRTPPGSRLLVVVRVAAPVEVGEAVALRDLLRRLALFRGLGGALRLDLGVVADLGREVLLDLDGLLEHRVLGQLLLDDVHELETRELEELDRLLQLRRHHQLLRELELLFELDRHCVYPSRKFSPR